MALFSHKTLNSGERRREVSGWAAYDFANSGYITVVLAAVFSAYSRLPVATASEIKGVVLVTNTWPRSGMLDVRCQFVVTQVDHADTKPREFGQEAQAIHADQLGRHAR